MSVSGSLIVPDVISQLPLLTWRGLEAPPYDAIDFDWSMELGARGVPYVDVEVHDNVRRKSAVFKARLYFCETVEEGAFSTKWPQWLQALKFGDPDFLNHPVLGPVQARVSKVGGDVKARVRDGIIVDVEWVETNLDPSTQSADLASDIDLATATELADSTSSSVGVSYPTGQSTNSLFSLFQQIRGQIFSLEVTVEGAIDTLISNVEQMIAAVEAKNDNTAWPAYDALLNVWTALYAYKAKAKAVARQTSELVTRNETTIDAIARETSNTTAEIVGLNLQLLREPAVPKNSTVRYYVSK